MKNKFYKLSIICAAFALVSILVSCEKKYTVPEWEWDDQEQEANPEITKLGWSVADFGELPKYISVYSSPNNIQSKKVRAYIAVADMSQAKFEILGDVYYNESKNGWGADALHTPSEFYTSSKAPIVINGGLFYFANNFYYSQNLVIKNGKLLAPNQNYYSKDWVKLWYPTLGAFCYMKDGSYSTTYTYMGNDKINYCYPEPADNDINKDPLEVPSATFPAGGKVLEAQTAIGGVTVLIKNGQIKNTYVQEMLDISAASNHPRTAIGITADKKMILFVCEGRNATDGISGLTTLDVANIMKDLGCVEALNLDGGGSSCMLVNGKSTIKESDGKQRKVLTAVILK
jgi:Exopolysaccharide biosynthesis protein related to N-acetylglucosamine-1-phosphodiester alpha-N-acetylglucosaminidase